MEKKAAKKILILVGLIGILISLLPISLLPMPAGAANLYDAYEKRGSANALVYGARWYGQVFTASATYTLTSVRLDMHRAGDTAPVGTVSIYSIAASGVPLRTGILSTISFESHSITRDTDGHFYTIPLSTPVRLIQGYRYAIVLQCDSGDSSTYIGWRYDATGEYEGGYYIASTDSGLTWTINADYDFRFSCWGELRDEIYEERYEFYSAADYEYTYAVYGDIQVAQTFTTGTAAHSVNRVRLLVGRGGSPGDMTITIQGTVDGVPSGEELVSVTIDADSVVPESINWVYFQFDTNIDLAILTTYAIVLSCPGGDSANYVQWAYDTTGYEGGTICRSYDGGSEWTIAEGDAGFEVLGVDSLRIISASVFSSYAETGDWLITIYCYAQVPPAYPVESPDQYLSLVLQTPGGRLVAKTPVQYWGHNVASIYLSRASVVYLGLRAGVPYVVAIVPTSRWEAAPDPALYTLSAINWAGTDKQRLDQWVRSTAQAIEAATSIDIYTEHTPTGVVYGSGFGVLTTEGAELFLAGIPLLDQVRPNLFFSVRREVTPTRGMHIDRTSRDPETMVGSYMYDLLERAGGMFNMSGRLFGACIMLVCFIGAVAVGVARHGDPRVALLAAIPIALMALYPGFWPWTAICLAALFCVFLILQVTVLRHG